MTKWILIYLYVTTNGAFTATAEFNNLAACEIAGEKLKNTIGPRFFEQYRYICSPKE